MFQEGGEELSSSLGDCALNWSRKEEGRRGEGRERKPIFGKGGKA